jgi:uncharacterized phiE125 gp8 family phage protein
LLSVTTLQPVSLADAKRHLNIAASNTDHDLYIANLLAAARAQVEAHTSRKLLTQTVTRYFDGWPDGDELVLPYGNLASVTSVHYKGTDGNWVRVYRAPTGPRRPRTSRARLFSSTTKAGPRLRCTRQSRCG